MRAYSPQSHGLVLDLTGAQDVSQTGERRRDDVVAHARAMLRIPGLVRGLFLNPLLPFAGRLHSELLDSPLLTWADAAAFAAAGRDGPLAYHVMAPIDRFAPLHSILPEFAQDPAVPLIMTIPDHAGLLEDRNQISLLKQAALVVALSSRSGEALAQVRIDAGKIAVVGEGEADAPPAWDAVAQLTAGRLDRLPPPAPRIRVAAAHLRVALVGPEPPTASGIAVYNHSLVPELARRCRLDVIYTAAEPPPQVAGVRRFPISALGRHLNPASYDAIVYTVGNSEHHHRTLEVARAHRGVVWFHDVRMGGFYRSLADRMLDNAGGPWLAEQLREMYGARVTEGAATGFNGEWVVRFALGSTRQWVGLARAVVVNSRLAERLLRLDQGPDASLPPIRRVPFAAQSFPNGLPPYVAEDDDARPVVATFGIVDRIKGAQPLLEAMALVRKRIDARLVYVGPVLGWFREEMEAAVADIGLQDAVEFTDRVGDDEYNGWLARAACAVQLRMGTNGEMSLAVSECLSAGVPVITNMMGVGSEYEEGALARLAPDASVEEIADQIMRLLTDPQARAQQAEAAAVHLSNHTYGKVADGLIDVVCSLRSQAGGP